MTQREKAEKVQEMRNGIGAIAEMCLIFMRAAMAQGATMEEAAALTRAYTEALLSEGRRKKAEDAAITRAYAEVLLSEGRREKAEEQAAGGGE